MNLETLVAHVKLLEVRLKVVEADLKERERDKAKKEYVRERMIKVYERTGGRSMKRQEDDARTRFEKEWEELNKE